MDFKIILEKLLSAFAENDVRYALIGGFALGAWGAPRGTVDLDFLLHRDDMETIHGIMTSMDYDLRYKTENVSQYISPLKVFGEVDFIHAFREKSLGMLGRAKDKKMFDEKIIIKVLTVEDLIGFKVQAIKNDESRKGLDLNDIESLMQMHGKNMDWPLVEEHFDLFGFNELFDRLRRKHGSN